MSAGRQSITRTVRPCSAIVTARWSARGRHQGGQHHDQRTLPEAARHSPIVDEFGRRLDAGHDLQHPAQLAIPGRRWQSSHASRANHRQRDAVAGADVVLGDRAGCAKRDIQARGAAVDPVALADVIERVDEQHDVSIVISPRRGDMQGACAQRLSPVDAAQSVTRLEGTDACELGPAALRLRGLPIGPRTSRPMLPRSPRTCPRV